MRTGIKVEVSATDRIQLDAIAADRNVPRKHVCRARIVLLMAEGCGTAEIMRDVRYFGQRPAPSMTTRFWVTRCLRRYWSVRGGTGVARTRRISGADTPPG